uniref:Uncharacterized protein n=1 Tax=Arundo donax TaxID=35708 RepID=A0A0A9BYZ4_ARUDO
MFDFFHCFDHRCSCPAWFRQYFRLFPLFSPHLCGLFRWCCNQIGS